MNLTSILTFELQLILVIVVYLFSTIFLCVVSEFISKKVFLVSDSNNQSDVLSLLAFVLYLTIVISALYFIRLMLKKYITFKGIADFGVIVSGPIITIPLIHKTFVKTLLRFF